MFPISCYTTFIEWSMSKIYELIMEHEEWDGELDFKLKGMGMHWIFFRRVIIYPETYIKNFHLIAVFMKVEEITFFKLLRYCRIKIMRNWAEGGDSESWLGVGMHIFILAQRLMGSLPAEPTVHFGGTEFTVRKGKHPLSSLSRVRRLRIGQVRELWNPDPKRVLGM